MNLLWRSLTARLLILFLLLAIVPLLVIGFLAYDSGRRSIVNNVEAHLESVVILKQQVMTQGVEHLEDSITSLATSPQTRSDAATLAAHAAGDPEYLAAHDSLVAALRRMSDLEHLSPVFLLDSANGRIVASSETGWEGLFRETEAWFIQGKTGTTVSDMTHSLSLGRPTMIVAAPVTDSDGQLLGVLAGHANLDVLSEIMLERSGLGATGETYLVNQSNLLLTEIRSEPDVAFKKWIFTERVSRALEGESGVGLYLDYRGIPVIGAYRWLEDKDMALLAEIDQAEALAPVVALRNTVLGIGLALALAVALLGLLVARTITRPVRQLVLGAEQIGRGNLDTRIEVAAQDEIGQLSHAFNQMAQNLKAITASRDELNTEIAERVRAEGELRQYQDQLEELVDDRTRELREAQEQLVRREKLAVLGQLAGGVGHELRNPLGAIKNAVYFLNMVLEDPDLETREMLEILDKEVDTAEKIISSLLDFARARPPTRRKVDLNDVVRQTLSRTPLPDAPRVEVALKLDEDLPLILADPDQLFQVLGNIVRNGIQAMADGGRLVVRTARESPEWVTVSIADTGAGISEENLKKIFEPLFTTKAKGIGLGLALVKTQVEAHGGTIGVESQGVPGEGSTFTVRLPLGASAVIKGEGA